MASPTPQWLDIPYRIEFLYTKYAGAAQKLITDRPEAESWTLSVPEGDILILSPRFTKAAQPLGWLTKMLGAPARFMGGPNSLTLTLLGSALGGGLGGASGWAKGKLGDKLGPYGKKEKRRLVRNWAIAGLLAGALPGLGVSGLQLYRYGLPGLLKRWPPESKMVASASVSRFEKPLEDLTSRFGIRIAGDKIEDEAVASAATIFEPTINEPAWRTLLYMDPYLTPQKKAMAAAIPFTASLVAAKRNISPYDVMETAARAKLSTEAGLTLGKIAECLVNIDVISRDRMQKSAALAHVIDKLF